MPVDYQRVSADHIAQNVRGRGGVIYEVHDKETQRISRYWWTGVEYEGVAGIKLMDNTLTNPDGAVPSGVGLGTAGLNGWTPVLAVVADGTRFVQRVTDWTGGQGAKPTVGLYLGAGGFVADIASASNVRGADGDPGTDGLIGWTPVFALVSDGARRVQQVTDWTGGTGSKPATGQYVGPTGLVATAALATDVRGAAGQDGAPGAGSSVATLSVSVPGAAAGTSTVFSGVATLVVNVPGASGELIGV